MQSEGLLTKMALLERARRLRRKEGAKVHEQILDGIHRLLRLEPRTEGLLRARRASREQ